MPANPEPASPEPRAPGSGSGRAGTGLVPGVVAVGVATVVAVVGLLIWDGGDVPGAGTVGRGGGVAGQGASSGASGTGSATGGGADDDSSGPSGGGAGAAPATAFDPRKLAPAGGTLVAPQFDYVDLEWSVTGSTWQEVLAAYEDRFPVEGFELGTVTKNWGGPGGEGGKGFAVVPGGSGPDATGVGTLDVHLDADETTVLVSWTPR